MHTTTDPQASGTSVHSVCRLCCWSYVSYYSYSLSMTKMVIFPRTLLPVVRQLSKDTPSNTRDGHSYFTGGWTRPSIKQYKGTTSACGTGVDLNWYPNFAAPNRTLAWGIWIGSKSRCACVRPSSVWIDSPPPPFFWVYMHLNVSMYYMDNVKRQCKR